jgi:hypothetical protein
LDYPGLNEVKAINQHSMANLLELQLNLCAQDALICVPQLPAGFHQRTLNDHKIVVAKVFLAFQNPNGGWWLTL